MSSFRLTHLFALYLFIAQVLATTPLMYVPTTDGSYSWQSSATTLHLSPNQVKAAAKAGYEDMFQQASSFHIRAATVMAALYIPSQRGADGLLILASSIKGARASEATTNYCSDQHIHGGCAEVNAFSLVDHNQINCSGSMVAAYGLRGGKATFMPPCQDRSGQWGCASFCKQSQITPVTKRSRIRDSASDLEQEKRALDSIVELAE